ncbi:unnamed protein product [Acanthoscelides obtectus]|nr:unnamed protein product [Acanthoscelides obtectus]CAK1631179.1 Transcriptional repressor CTCF [Acanthoscelides obtectus]
MTKDSIKSDPDNATACIKTEEKTEAIELQANEIKLEDDLDNATLEITEGLIAKSEYDDRSMDVIPDMIYNGINNDYIKEEDGPKFTPVDYEMPMNTDNGQNVDFSWLHSQSNIEGESHISAKIETMTEMKFVKVEIKTEHPENYSDAFAVYQSSLNISNSYNVDETVLNSIKSDPDNATACIKTEAIELQPNEIKLEDDLDNATLEITEGLIAKSEYDDRSMDLIPDMIYNGMNNDYIKEEDGPKFTPVDYEMPMNTDNGQNLDFTRLHSQSNIDGESSVAGKQHRVACNKATGELFSCYNCEHTACCKDHLVEHMEEHKQHAHSISSTSCNSSSSFKCIYCSSSFKTKRTLDEHIVKKHPTFKSTISSKLHECTFCSYKTTKKDMFSNHMSKQHPDNVHMLTCKYCNAIYSSKSDLDYHIDKKHPEFKHCTYESGQYKCNYCNAVYLSKRGMNVHIGKKHNELTFILSESTSRSELCVCKHCNATFSRKWTRDNHILRKHPEFISSTSCKVLECTYCSFKTAIKDTFHRHMLRHKLNTCKHCNESFQTDMMLNTHIFQKHDIPFK